MHTHIEHHTKRPGAKRAQKKNRAWLRASICRSTIGQFIFYISTRYRHCRHVRAPRRIFLPNQFRKRSNSVLLIGYKMLFSQSKSRVNSQCPEYQISIQLTLGLRGWFVYFDLFTFYIYLQYFPVSDWLKSAS